MKGNKPDFHEAMKNEDSKPLYEKFVESMKENYVHHADKIKGLKCLQSIKFILQSKRLVFTQNVNVVSDGQFGAYMQVHIQNDGPVTMNLESPSFTPVKTHIILYFKTIHATML